METTKTLVVGIDVSKDSLQVCYKQRDTRTVIKGTHSFPNNLKGFSELLEWCVKRGNEKPLFVMEATGVYHEELTHYLHEQGYPVAVILANKIKHFGKSMNVKSKTDKNDASLIADYGLERNPAHWKPMTPKFHTLRQLCREMLAFKRDVVRAKNQYHAFTHAYNTSQKVLTLKSQQIDFLEKAIETLEKEILQTAAQDPAFEARIQQISSIPGLGVLTIIIILCEVDGFGQFNNIRQVVSFAGLDITEKQSGTFVGQTRISKKGNSRIRQCLYMPALSACSCNKPIKDLYARVVERNPKIKRKGIVAGMRKLLILVFVLWVKNEAYNAEYEWKKKTSGNNKPKPSYCAGS